MISLRELSYGERLQALDLTTLVERRQRGDMIQIFKIFKGIDRMETYERYCFLRNLTRVHCFKYNKEISRQTHRENFLLNRAANYWNELPKEVVSAETVNIFKAGLDCWMITIELISCHSVLKTHSLVSLPVTAINYYYYYKTIQIGVIILSTKICRLSDEVLYINA